MVVYDLLSEIYKGNCPELPEKIKVDGKIYKKDIDWENYFTDDEQKRPLLSISNELNININLKVEEVKEGRLKPKKDTYYYFIDSIGDVDSDWWANDSIDNYRYDTRNCFETEKEAKQHLENIKTEIELRKLAEELNNDKKIEWGITNQSKYYLYYDYIDGIIKCLTSWNNKRAKTIYCLDKDFEEKAIEKIGKEKPIVYDLVDGIMYFENMYRTRKNYYKKNGNEIYE